MSVEKIIVDNKFKMTVPEGWQDQSIYRFVGPELDGLQHAITLTIDHALENQSLEQFSQLKISALRETLQGYLELKQKEITLENGTRAFELVFRWTPVQNAVVLYHNIFIVAKQKGYSLAGQFTMDSYEMIGKAVVRKMYSFEPIG
ncbi:MAG: DcrB-related protein [Pseudomonadota bacterium]